MRIRVLGCSGSIAAGNRTTCFLLDEDVLIDAGTGVGDLSLDELSAIDHILLTHSHLDHVLSVGLLADSVMRRRRHLQRPPIQVHALAQTAAALQTHLFNGVIWPDFTRLPTPDSPMLRFEHFKVGQSLHLGSRHVEVLTAEHTVPACGFAIHGEQGAWVFTGDTGPNPALWQRLEQLPVRQLIIETAFRNDEQVLAELSGHLSPASLLAQLRHFQQPCEVFITHIKPGDAEVVMREIGDQAQPHRVRALQAGMSFQV